MNESETSKGLFANQKTLLFAPGSKVKVTQQIARPLDPYAVAVVGTVVRQERQGSGSWYARNANNKVWLDRLVIQKADGEMSILNLDEYTNVEVLEGPAPTVGSAALVSPNQDRTASTT